MDKFSWGGSREEEASFLKACSTGDVAFLHKVAEELKHDKVALRALVAAKKDGNNMHGTHLAAEAGRAEVLRILFHDFDADVMLLTVRGNTACHIAARADKAECLRLVLQKSNEMWLRVRLLWVAFYKPTAGSILNKLPKDMIRYLARMLMQDNVTFNKVITMRNGDGLTALEYAVQNNARSCYSLLVSPVTVKAISSVLGNPLHYAAAHGCMEACDILIKIDPWSINELNMRNETPLYRACCAFPECPSVVKLLLNKGADATLKAKCGKTALEEAEARKYVASAKLIRERLGGGKQHK